MAKLTADNTKSPWSQNLLSDMDGLKTAVKQLVKWISIDTNKKVGLNHYLVQ